VISLIRQRLLVIAPHPDDEVIGCGGLIQKIKENGGKVFVLFLTVGDTKDFSEKGKSSASSRKKEIEHVAKFLKYDNYHIAFPGNKYHLKLDSLGQLALMNMIERESKVSIEKVKPTIVAFPSPTSYNQDHHMAALAAHAALRPAPNSLKHFVNIVLSYEEVGDLWSLSANFTPNLLIPLSIEELDKKLTAIKLYITQYRKEPSTRSKETIMAHSKLLGSLCGNQYAEGFKTQRIFLQ